MDVILISNYPRGLDADLDFKKLDIRRYPADLKTLQACQEQNYELKILCFMSISERIIT
jgi:hypothetical protein